MPDHRTGPATGETVVGVVGRPEASPPEAPRPDARSPRADRPAPARSPEALFHVGPPAVADEYVRGAMRLGPWAQLPTGELCAGALGVLADDVLGLSVFRRRPPGWQSVTAELSLDVAHSRPAADARLTAEGRLSHLDISGGLAECRVCDEAGQLVAVATARCQFTLFPTVAGTAAPPSPGSWDDGVPGGPYEGGSVLDTLGAWVETDHRSARIVVDDASGFTNDNGSVHGGVLFCLAELAGTTLAGVRAGATGDAEPSVPRTSSVRMNYVRPAPLDGRLIATAAVLHEGRSVSVYGVTTTGPAGRPYTLATVTQRRVAQPGWPSPGGPARVD